MGKIMERCAGIDVGKRFLLCCVLTGAAQDDPNSKTLRFDTTVPALERLREWLNREGVTHVVMESTGSYGIPIFNILEGQFAVSAGLGDRVPRRTLLLCYRLVSPIPLLFRFRSFVASMSPPSTSA